MGWLTNTASVTDSYAVGAVTTGTSSPGGLVGFKTGTTTAVTASYWDTTTSGQTSSPGGGTGKNTSELKSPTSNTGIYAGWDTANWDHGTATDYPRLKADLNGDGTATVIEFGGQGEVDPVPAFANGASIAGQELTQGASYTSAAAFPAATGGDGTLTYSVASLPSGITLNSDRKLTGTAAAPLAKTPLTPLTYTVTDGDATEPDTDTLTFNISVVPQKPAGFTAAAGAGRVTLSWTAIPGVTKWQYQQGEGQWTNIRGSLATTTGHTVTGLAGGDYSFKVRAVVGSGGAAVNGIESDPATASPTAVTGSVAGDKAALRAFGSIAGWSNKTNWNTNQSLRHWHGVKTNGDGRVTELNLHSNRLNYQGIPRELGNLSELTKLQLGSNGLTGSIPAELGNLTNLEYLDLESNKLTGAIPAELGNLANLKTLRLSWNGFTGSIPAELGGLENLERLYIQNTKLSGVIPAELGDLPKIKHIALGNNGLTGAIPAKLGELSTLTALYLHNNALTGAIPAKLGDLAALKYLHLGGNSELTAGDIPAWLNATKTQDMFFLNLSGTNRTGAIPAKISELTDLEFLYLHDNDLTGAIPETLSALTELGWLVLNDNQLTGEIPTSFTAMTELYKLQYNNNTVDDAALCAPWDADFRTWLYGKLKIGPDCAITAGTEFTYSVRMILAIGDRSTADSVQDAYHKRIGNAGYIVSVPSTGTSGNILSAANSLSRHSITANSRYIDAEGEVHNFQAGKGSYWRIRPIGQKAARAKTYTVKLVKVADATSIATVKSSAKPVVKYDYAVILPDGASDADILNAASDLSLHNISADDRYIGTEGDVHNFEAGLRTYWLIDEVD